MSICNDSVIDRTGDIIVDTSDNPVALYLSPTDEGILSITKTSTNHPIALISTNGTTINGDHICMFIKGDKLELKCKNGHWKIRNKE